MLSLASIRYALEQARQSRRRHQRWRLTRRVYRKRGQMEMFT